MSEFNIQALSSSMKNAVDHLVDALEGVRGSRVSPNLLDQLQVHYNGGLVRLKNIAVISLIDSTALQVNPFDQNDMAVSGEIKKAIRDHMQLDAVEFGSGLKVVIPPLTEQRKKDLVKQVEKYGEEEKIVIRNLRRKALDEVKSLKGKISQDEEKRLQKKVDELADKSTKDIEAIVQEKSKHILGTK